MNNTKCLLCGSTGYQGFIQFECDNPTCSAYKPAVKTQSNHLQAINWQVCSTKTPYEQQKIAEEFLGMLIDGYGTYVGPSSPTAGEKAVIAGGAPRDWYFKRVAKDIDIFTVEFVEQWFSGAFPSITLINKTHQKTKNKTDPYYGLDALNVFDCTFKGEQFQIIKVPFGKTVKDHIETFDFGINMISMDRTGTIYQTNEFMKDVACHRLTTYPAKLSPQNIKYLGKRAAKMKSKFPNFAFNIE